MKVSLKRFRVEVRDELKEKLAQESWQKLHKEFSINTFTRLTAEGLDKIVDLDDNCSPEIRREVQRRIEYLKLTDHGTVQTFRVKSGANSFYRYWLIGRHNYDGLYDIVYCHISRTEEAYLFGLTAQAISYLVGKAVSSPRILSQLLPSQISPLAIGCLREGIGFGQETANEAEMSDQSFTQQLKETLIEYELVEDLIERGILGENSDGTLFLRF